MHIQPRAFIHKCVQFWINSNIPVDFWTENFCKALILSLPIAETLLSHFWHRDMTQVLYYAIVIAAPICQTQCSDRAVLSFKWIWLIQSLSAIIVKSHVGCFSSTRSSGSPGETFFSTMCRWFVVIDVFLCATHSMNIGTQSLFYRITIHHRRTTHC